MDDRVGGRYLVLEEIGQGGMGRVLAARNEATGKRVALKHLLDRDPAATARFEREARAAGRIHHPNVVDVYDVLHDGDVMFLVMELLRGEPLSSVLRREGRLEIAEAVAVATQLSLGVAAAHAEGVIHRDLKPANLFLCQRAPATHVKILDFGISKLVEPEGGHAATRSDIVLGTPHFFSPEQVRGGPVDPRTDLYAIGAILYMMLTGRPPHDHTHVPALLVEIATAAPVPVDRLRPETPARLARLVHRALAKEPDARWQSAESLAAALQEVLHAAAVETTASPAALDEATRPVRSSEAAAGLVAAPHTPAMATPATATPAVAAPAGVAGSTRWQRRATWSAASAGLAALGVWMALADASPERLVTATDDASRALAEPRSVHSARATVLTQAVAGATVDLDERVTEAPEPSSVAPSMPEAEATATTAGPASAPRETPDEPTDEPTVEPNETGEPADARAASAREATRRRSGLEARASATTRTTTETGAATHTGAPPTREATTRSARRAGELHLDDF